MIEAVGREEKSINKSFTDSPARLASTRGGTTLNNIHANAETHEKAKRLMKRILSFVSINFHNNFKLLKIPTFSFVISISLKPVMGEKGKIIHACFF